MANESINLNLIPSGEMPVIHASQFDNGRQFNINLFKGTDEYTLPAGYTASLNCRKADRNIVTLPVTTASTNILTFTTTTQLCACAGNNLCEIVIKDAEDYQVGTLNFILAVEKDPLQGGIDSTSEIHDLEDQIEEIAAEIIGENYYTKTETDTLLDAKANAADVYTKSQTDTLLSAKADTSSVYTKTQTDTLLSAKADASSVYTKSQTDTLLSAKADTSSVYTKSQTDTLLSAKADVADLATVATTGDYDDLTNKPTIPAAQVQSDYAQVDNTKVDYIKNKPDLSVYAKESDLILATGTENEAPYQIRTAPSNIGTLALEKLVGLTVCFNQLVENGNFSNGTTGWLTRDGATISASDNVGTVTFTSASISAVKRPITMVQNHVYLIQASVKGNDGKNIYFALTNNGGSPIAPQKTITPTADWSVVSVLNKMTQTVSNDEDLNCIMFRNASGEANTINIKEVEVFDLSAMFGSEVADYLYTLESGTAGSGVALFKSLFGADYYPFTANTLMSAKPTGKVIKDENDQTIETIVYSGNELRGLIKVGTNGLYADGDIDDGSGRTAVRYEERAYQSGDESLTDAITDGTNTVVKRASPTTAISTAWSNPIRAAAGGTEEFTDIRTIKMPTGHDTIYSKKTDYRYWG